MSEWIKYIGSIGQPANISDETIIEYYSPYIDGRIRQKAVDVSWLGVPERMGGVLA